MHISAAVCLFTGMGIWLFGIAAIARASQVEQIHTLTDLLLMVRLVVPISALLAIAAGVAMTRIAWGFQTGWIAVALGSLAIIGPIGTWVVDPKVCAIANLTQTLPDGPLPPILGARTHDRVLRMAIHMLVAMLFGIVFLMTTKPNLVGALSAMLVSTFLGLVTSLPFLITRCTIWTGRTRRHHE
jgi:hypothetical protein